MLGLFLKGRATPQEAAKVGKSLELNNLFWLEDTVLAENQEASRLIRQHTTTPLASEPDKNLWLYTRERGYNMKLCMDFITPYAADKTGWPFPKDIAYWHEPAQRHAFLLFGAQQFEDCSLWELAKPLDTDRRTYEVIRNMPIGSPLLWMKD